MTTLEPHPFSALFPPITAEDFDKLAGDIKLHGLHQPIMRYQGKILDDNNRYRACELAKIAPKFADFNGDDAAARNYVISANIHRRHLSADQRREIIATLLKSNPNQSNRQIGEQTNTSHHVEAVRAGLETTGQIAQLESTTGADGKKRKRKGSSRGNVQKNPSDKYDAAQAKLIEKLQDLDVDAAPTKINIPREISARPPSSSVSWPARGLNGASSLCNLGLKRQVLVNDQRVRNQASTFSQFAQADADTPRGRFTTHERSTVVGSTPTPASA